MSIPTYKIVRRDGLHYVFGYVGKKQGRALYMQCSSGFATEDEALDMSRTLARIDHADLYHRDAPHGGWHVQGLRRRWSALGTWTKGRGHLTSCGVLSSERSGLCGPCGQGSSLQPCGVVRPC